MGVKKLNLEQFEYILEVSKTNKISVAAQNLHVSQSGVSQAIHRLEEELGFEVFERRKDGTYPTELGILIIEKAHHIMDEIKQVRQISSLNKDESSKQLIIGSTPGFILTVLPKTLSKFKEKHPEIDIQFQDDISHQIITNVKNETLDIGLILKSEINDYQGIEYEVLYNGKMHACVNPNSPFANLSSISPEDLIHETFALYRSDNMNQFLKDIFNGQKLKNILFTTNDINSLKRAVVESHAITFAVDYMIQDDPLVVNGDIKLVPISNHKAVDRKYGWIRASKTNKSKVINDFITCLKANLP